jgi:hypothetical protein
MALLAVIGSDADSERFLEAALAGGDVVTRRFDSLADEVPDAEGRLVSLQDLVKLRELDGVVVGGTPAEKSRILKSLTQLVPVDVIVSTPVTDHPDPAFEFSLYRTENDVRVIPLFREDPHPLSVRIRELLDRPGVAKLAWVELGVPRPESGAVPDDPRELGLGWALLRRIAGGVVFLTATGSEKAGDGMSGHRAAAAAASSIGGSAGETPLAVATRTTSGALAGIRWSRPVGGGWRLRLETTDGRDLEAELPQGPEGPAQLRGSLMPRPETVEPAPVASRWLERWRTQPRGPAAAELWQDAVQQTEIIAAIRRSLKYGRQVDLTRDEFTEEAGFKGVMATAGCAMVWILLLMFILMAFRPFAWLQYLVLPMLCLWLALQAFVLAYRRPDASKPETTPEPAPEPAGGFAHHLGGGVSS